MCETCAVNRLMSYYAKNIGYEYQTTINLNAQDNSANVLVDGILPTDEVVVDTTQDTFQAYQLYEPQNEDTALFSNSLRQDSNYQLCDANAEEWSRPTTTFNNHMPSNLQHEAISYATTVPYECSQQEYTVYELSTPGACAHTISNPDPPNACGYVQRQPKTMFCDQQSYGKHTHVTHTNENFVQAGQQMPCQNDADPSYAGNGSVPYYANHCVTNEANLQSLYIPGNANGGPGYTCATYEYVQEPNYLHVPNSLHHNGNYRVNQTTYVVDQEFIPVSQHPQQTYYVPQDHTVVGHGPDASVNEQMHYNNWQQSCGTLEQEPVSDGTYIESVLPPFHHTQQQWSVEPTSSYQCGITEKPIQQRLYHDEHSYGYVQPNQPQSFTYVEPFSVSTTLPSVHNLHTHSKTSQTSHPVEKSRLPADALNAAPEIQSSVVGVDNDTIPSPGEPISPCEPIHEYVCSQCGKRFNRQSHILIHFRSHSGEKPFTCRICTKSFSQASNLHRHIKSHKAWPRLRHIGGNLTSNQLLFKPSQSIMSVIRRVKSLPAPITKDFCILDNQYECGFCGKRFEGFQKIRSHMVEHEDEKVYQCMVSACQKTFQELDLFVDHLNNIHDISDLKWLTCNICENTFDSEFVFLLPCLIHHHLLLLLFVILLPSSSPRTSSPSLVSRRYLPPLPHAPSLSPPSF